MRKREGKTKWLKHLLLVCAVLSMVCLSRVGMLIAKAATVVDSGNCGAEGVGSNLTWTLEDEGTLTISGTGAMRDYYLNMPWYDKRESIKTIVINSSVASIGDSAFRGCSSVTSITISDSVTSIGSYAFANCTSLTSITIPSSVTSIGGGAFYDCSSLTVTTPLSACEFYNKFENVDEMDLENMNFQGGYTHRFSSEVLSHATDNIKGEYKSTCEDCNSTITLEFYSDKDLSTVCGITGTGIFSIQLDLELPEKIDNGILIGIGNCAFENCYQLRSITIPDSVTSIGYNAFEGCRNLRSITIPDSVTSIGIEAFCECRSLTSIKIPNKVTYIGYYAFNGCSSLESVSIPNSVTSIDGAAFENCSSLTNITIPDSVTRIGASAFHGCSALTNIVFPLSVKSIDDHAFGMYYSSLYNAYKPLEGYTVSGYTNSEAYLYAKSNGLKFNSIGTLWEISFSTNYACPPSQTVIQGESYGILPLPEKDAYPDDYVFVGWFTQAEGGTQITSDTKVNLTSDQTLYAHWKKIAVEEKDPAPGTEKQPESNTEKQLDNGMLTVADDGTLITSETQGFKIINGNNCWFENGIQQGVKLKADGTPDLSYRGKEIYDPESDEWYWLDNIQYGAIARSKDVYQESQADDEGNIGKWVRYDENGHMVKGWDTNQKGAYYFDPIYGTMLKGDQVIDGVNYHFDEVTGIMTYCSISLENHWEIIDGVEYWYENGQRQGRDVVHKSYRGKEIYDPVSDAWYWLDNVDAGKKAVSKDVYQESGAGPWGDKTNEKGEKIGKWVRYDAEGRMIKGWCAGKGTDAVRIDSPDQSDGRSVYYFDWTYGTMAKGEATIDGITYTFDLTTGILQK